MTLGEMSSSRLSSARVFSPVRIRWTAVRLNSGAEDASAVCLPPVLAHGASRRILRPQGEQSKWGALQEDGCRVEHPRLSGRGTGARDVPESSEPIGLRAKRARLLC